MSINANKQLVREFWEAMIKGDQERLMALLAEDLRYFSAGDLPSCAPCSSCSEYVARMMRVMSENLVGGGVVKLGDITAEDNRVAVEVESRCQTKNGKLYNNFYHFLYYIENGKIAGLKEYCDTLHASETFVGELITGPRLERKTNLWNVTAVFNS